LRSLLCGDTDFSRPGDAGFRQTQVGTILQSPLASGYTLGNLSAAHPSGRFPLTAGHTVCSDSMACVRLSWMPGFVRKFRKFLNAWLRNDVIALIQRYWPSLSKVAHLSSEELTMPQAKQTSKRKRRSKALPVLGAAGLSLSLASGASAVPNGLGVPTSNTGDGNQVTLGEEEISDVSLATFYVFDKEGDGTSPLVQLVGRGCHGCHGCGGGRGCRGCGGCHHGCGCHGCGGCHHGCGGCGCVSFFFGGCGGCGGCGGGYWCWINGVRTWCPYNYGY
jgi:hypothetical protein